MADYLTRDTVESVALNTAIPFLDLNPCTTGNVIHQNGSGIFILRGKGECVSTYDVEFTGNVSIPTGGTVGPIATAIVIDGETQQASRSILKNAAVDE